jgi:Kdo2-lipid IVA lauroyltransferase/acyltransferase
MSETTLLHRIEYGAYHLVAGLTQRLPLGALRWWGRAVGRLAYHLLPGRRALTLDNLARALPELDDAQRRRVARRCFEVQSSTYHEQVWAMRRGDQIADRFEIVGREHFEAARARGKGVFVLTGHFGCWELAGYPLGRWLGQLHIVARPQNNPYIAAHFAELRERNGNAQIDRGRAGTRMLKVLRKGGAIGVAIDQRVRPSQAVLVPFLGRYAWTSRLPAYLSTVTGCAAVPMVCVPLDDGRYRMTFDAPILPEGEGDDEIERLTRRYAAALEPYIRQQPELWLWMHSRWRRTRPQRRPEAISRLIEEADLPTAAPLREVGQRSAAAPVQRLQQLVGDAFLEDCRHLLLLTQVGHGREPGARPRLATATDSGAATRQSEPDGRVAASTAATGPIAAAASVGHAFARLGHPTRYFTLDSLCDALAAEHESGRLDAALRELDPASLVVVDRADPRQLEPSRRELLRRFLAHRRERGSVLLAGAAPAAWQEAGSGGPAARDSLDAFVASCEVVDLSSLDAGAFGVAGAAAPRAERPGETEAQAPAV